MSSIHSLACLSFGTMLLTGCGAGKTPEWETFQGNAAHTGHVNTTYNPQNFNHAWTFDTPDPTQRRFINPVASGKGLLFISQDGYSERQQLIAVRDIDGSIAWTYDFGTIAHVNPPAYKAGKVYVTSSGHGDTFLWVFDADSGELQGKTEFSAQWSHYLAPTVLNGIVYTCAGYYGGEISAFSATDGHWLWNSASNGNDDMCTPAATNNGLYHYGGEALQVLNPVTGALINTLDEVSPPPQYAYSLHSAPAVGSRNNVISFSGVASSGLASSSAEPDAPRHLISFDLTTNQMTWRTEALYHTHPAVADGSVYAGRQSPAQLDAIDEATGAVSWSWIPTSDSGISRFHHNVISTRNLLFVVSDVGVHTISKSTRKEVWRYDQSGAIALSSSNQLHIAEGIGNTTGRVHAINLK